MFCYNCAAPNNDGVKFCRACGANLETVAQAIAAKPKQGKPIRAEGESSDEDLQSVRPDDWLGKRSKGYGKILSGASYLVATLLLPLLVYLVLHDRTWFLITLLCVSWVFFVGLDSMAKGFSAVMESNTMMRGLGGGQENSSSHTGHGVPDRLADTSHQQGIAQDHVPRGTATPTSVTESTTQLLDEHTS